MKGLIYLILDSLFSACISAVGHYEPFVNYVDYLCIWKCSCYLFISGLPDVEFHGPLHLVRTVAGLKPVQAIILIQCEFVTPLSKFIVKPTQR